VLSSKTKLHYYQPEVRSGTSRATGRTGYAPQTRHLSFLTKYASGVTRSRRPTRTTGQYYYASLTPLNREIAMHLLLALFAPSQATRIYSPNLARTVRREQESYLTTERARFPVESR